MMGPLFEDESGQGDIHLRISMMTVILSTAVLLVVGVISGLVPACGPRSSIPSKPCVTNNKSSSQRRLACQVKRSQANMTFTVLLPRIDLLRNPVRSTLLLEGFCRGDSCRSLLWTPLHSPSSTPNGNCCNRFASGSGLD